jgi:hypothetical protein
MIEKLMKEKDRKIASKGEKIGVLNSVCKKQKEENKKLKDALVAIRREVGNNDKYSWEKMVPIEAFAKKALEGK